MDYDLNYQNEQSNSVYFQRAPEKNIIDLMESQQLLNGKIIEIGCGKDIF